MLIRNGVKGRVDRVIGRRKIEREKSNRKRIERKKDRKRKK